MVLSLIRKYSNESMFIWAERTSIPYAGFKTEENSANTFRYGLH